MKVETQKLAVKIALVASMITTLIVVGAMLYIYR